MATCAGVQPFWPHFTLHNNVKMPAIGLGTYKIRKEEDILRSVDEALASGYRLFDTAAVYCNEVHLRTAFEKCLPKYDLNREDIFIVSKLSPNEMHSKKVVKDAYKNSINNLGTEYLDLFLIHFPGQPGIEPKSSKHKIMREAAWSALTDLYDNGSVNAIGVSNFTVAHLQDMMIEKNCVVPMVNQVECHPIYFDEDVLSFCRENFIVVQGYAPLGGINSKRCMLDHDAVKWIAADLSVTPAQALLVWSLQKNVAVIPKSVNPDRIRVNFQLDFKLSQEHIKILDNLNCKKKFAWDSNLFL